MQSHSGAQHKGSEGDEGVHLHTGGSWIVKRWSRCARHTSVASAIGIPCRSTCPPRIVTDLLLDPEEPSLRDASVGGEEKGVVEGASGVSSSRDWPIYDDFDFAFDIIAWNESRASSALDVEGVDMTAPLRAEFGVAVLIGIRCSE